MGKLEVDDGELAEIHRDMAKAKEDGKEHLYFEDLLDVAYSKPHRGAYEETVLKAELEKFRGALAGAILQKMKPLMTNCRVTEHENRDGFRIFVRENNGRNWDVEYTYMEGIVENGLRNIDEITSMIEKKLLAAREMHDRRVRDFTAGR